MNDEDHEDQKRFLAPAMVQKGLWSVSQTRSANPNYENLGIGEKQNFSSLHPRYTYN